jgi:hypothetical protein
LFPHRNKLRLNTSVKHEAHDVESEINAVRFVLTPKGFLFSQVMQPESSFAVRARGAELILADVL